MNRYKNVFSKTFKIALANLLEEEEKALRALVANRFPQHMEEFDVALNIGMRKSEQYTLEWPEVRLGRRRIHLDKTKNGSHREIPMNKTCFSAFEALHTRRQKGHCRLAFSP